MAKVSTQLQVLLCVPGTVADLELVDGFNEEHSL